MFTNIHSVELGAAGGVVPQSYQEIGLPVPPRPGGGVVPLPRGGGEAVPRGGGDYYSSSRGDQMSHSSYHRDSHGGRGGYPPPRDHHSHSYQSSQYSARGPPPSSHGTQSPPFLLASLQNPPRWLSAPSPSSSG